MSQQLALSLRDDGMDRAAAHADAVHGGWSNFAYDILLRYAEKHEVFMAEDVREFARVVDGFEDPPDGRAWGSVVMRAAKAGIIKRIGYAPMKSPNCHANPKSVWRSLVFRGL